MHRVPRYAASRLLGTNGILALGTHGILALLLAAAAAPAAAQDEAPRFGRYMPLYPGMYFDGGFVTDDRDASFDAAGNEQSTAVPTAGGQTAFPENTLATSFTWHFPIFESQNVTFFSGRTHTARITLRYSDVKTEGALAAFAADPSDDADTEADDLRNNGKGIGDLTVEFGSFLYGSPAPDWRTRESTPLAVLAMIGLNLPFGEYDRDAPVSAGSNTTWAQLRLGAHWQPWRGGFIDAGAAYRGYFQNYEAAFGALAPTGQGDDLFWDVSLAQRLVRSLYLTAFYSHREGDPNLYENPRFAWNAPEPDDQNPLLAEDNFPTPGAYYDDGTELTTAGIALQYFVTQRWLAALHYTTPLSGKSGQFLLPFTNREPAGCTVGSVGCTTYEGDTVLVDGLGPARAFSSDRLMFTVSYNFWLGDAFDCTGCEQ